MKPSRSARRSARRGSALLIALATLVSVAALGVVFLQVITSTTRRQAAEGEGLRAFYLCEAGLAESFQAVRMGRTGQVGSEAAPAVHGEGLLWVDAVETGDRQVRLTSNAMVGGSRASLALVVEPIEIPLGFFSDEDLIVDDVLLVDGFNSEEATYEEETATDLMSIQAYGQFLSSRVEEMKELTEPLEEEDSHELANNADLSSEEEAELNERFEELLEAYNSGTLFPTSESVPSGGTGPNEPDVWDPIVIGDRDSTWFEGGVVTESTMAAMSSESPGSEAATATSTSSGISDVHTDSGGLLGSNGSVQFTVAGEPVEIFGDVVPGPNETVSGLSGVLVTGDSEPRSRAVELEPVEIPPVALAAPVRHEGLLPMVVVPGTSGHQEIVVAADAELILRGPATIVIGQLTLEPGAVLTLDTRDGDVELYVTGGMDLQPDSIVVTTSDYPDELSIQVGPIASDVTGAPVKLDATSQFHGTIYAPETDVFVGGKFEVYGGIVAKRLEIGAGAQLHFDNARYEGSPVPRIVSWRIVEIPATVRGRRMNPFLALGVERAALVPMADAHNLGSVTLTIDYRDTNGVLQSFDGTEDQFDWTMVTEIVQLERDPVRPREDPDDDGPDDDGPDDEGPFEDPVEEPEITEPRTDVQGALARYPSEMNAKDLVDILVLYVPLSQDEWTLVGGAGFAGGHYQRLVDADIAAGGTGN